MSVAPSPRQGQRFLASIGEPYRTFLILGTVVPISVFAMLGLTIGLLFLSEYLGQLLSFEQAFNSVLSVFLILVFLPICHLGCHRWFWHVEKRRQDGDFLRGEEMPEMFSEPTERPPPLRATPRQRLAYGLLYMVAMGLLLFIFLPLGHHQALYGFIDRFSSGRASASSLTGIIIVWMPLMAGLLGVGLYMERDMNRVRRHQVTDAEKQRIELRFAWLGAFVTAVTMTGFMCHFLGNLILRYLA